MVEKMPTSNLKLGLWTLLFLTALAFLSLFFTSLQTMPLLPAQVDIVATAQALQLRHQQQSLAEKSQGRIETLKAQIDQRHRSTVEPKHLVFSSSVIRRCRPK